MGGERCEEREEREGEEREERGGGERRRDNGEECKQEIDRGKRGVEQEY
jgi:hypothetical protein